MIARLRSAFERLLDWQTCSEYWAYVIQKRDEDSDFLFQKFQDGDRVDFDLLEFPLGYGVDVELVQGSFVVRPHRITGQLFSLIVFQFFTVTMLFRGWAEVRNDAIYIVGKYTVPSYYRRLHAAWNLGTVGLAVMTIPIAIMIGVEENKLQTTLLMAPIAQVAMAAGCTFLLALAKFSGTAVSLLNTLAGANLQNFLSEISVSDRAR